MADNVNITPGTGATVAADDIGGALHQRVKISQGADGAGIDVSSTAPLFVSLAYNTGPNATPVVVDLGSNNDVTVTGSVTANAGTNLNTSALALETTATSIKNAVEIIDNAIAGSEMQVDVVTSALPTGASTLAEQQSQTTHLSTIAGDTTSIQTAVELIDDTVYTDGTGTVSKGIAILGQDGTNPQAIKTDANGELQVDVLTMPTVAVTQSGTWDEVGINDSGNSITVDDGGTSLTVDGTVTVTATDLDIRNLAPATDTIAIGDGTSTATVRNLASNDALNVAITDGSGNQITSFGGGTQYTEGDTDASITGTALMFEGAADGLVAATGTAANGLDVDVTRVSGTVTVDGSGVTQPVSGTVTANLSATDNAVLDAIEADTTTIAGAVSGTELQVDVVGALPAGTNNIGDVDVLSVVPGTGATNLGKAEDGGHTTGDTGVFALAVRQDTPNTAVSNTDADYTQISVTSTGAVRNAPISEDFAALANGPQVKKYYANTGSVTDGIVWSPAAGKRWYVTDLILTTSAAATVTLEDDLAAGDSTVLALDLAANSGVSHSFQTPLFSGEDAADLLVTTTAGNIKITVVGYEI